VTDFRRPLHDDTVLAATRTGPDHDRYFADEIAIDFPSIGAVIDRMKNGLLGGDETPIAHNAAISLSRRDAHIGVTVPLEVPLRATCLSCGGRGETWTEPCASCAGSGERATPHHVRLCVPAGIADGTRLRFLVAPPHGVPTRVEVTVLVA
jgi:hypothetical protein